MAYIYMYFSCIYQSLGHSVIKVEIKVDICDKLVFENEAFSHRGHDNKFTVITNLKESIYLNWLDNNVYLAPPFCLLHAKFQ